MAYLTNLFGDEICVSIQPRQMQNQWVGFPGAEGIVGMYMGSRGRRITISGRLRSRESSSYNYARSDLQDWIDAIESNLCCEPQIYYYAGNTYNEVVFLNLRIVVNDKGKSIHWNGKGCFCDFVCDGLQLI
jgi:hypothetical protein